MIIKDIMKAALLISGLLLSKVYGQIGEPLYCNDLTDTTEQAKTWYLLRYHEEQINPDIAPSTDVIRVDLDSGGTWNETFLYSTPYATVAAGTAKLGSTDGYGYGLRGTGPWNRAGDYPHTLVRYGSSGAELVHPNNTPVSGLSNENLNAADLNPADPNQMIAGQLRNGYPLDRLYKIDIAANSATTLMLSPAITGVSSGDLVVDPSGQFAYGIAFTRGSFLPSSWFWRADLTTGAVTQKRINTSFIEPPYGGAAWLADGTIAFYFNGTVVSGIPLTSQMVIVDPTFLDDANVTVGTTVSSQTMTGSDSSDAFSCIAKDLTITPPNPTVSQPGSARAIPSTGVFALLLLLVGLLICVRRKF